MSEIPSKALEVPPSQEVSDLTLAVNQAKADIKEKSAKNDSGPRKRGRPKGSKNKNSDEINYSIHLQSPAAGEPQVSSAVTPTTGLAPIIETGIKIPFAIAANQTGFEGMNVSDEEAKPCVEAIDKAIFYFAPDFVQSDPKTAALYACLATVGGLMLTKWYVWSEWKKVIKAPPPMAPQTTEATATPAHQPDTDDGEIQSTYSKQAKINVNDYFGPRSATVY